MRTRTTPTGERDRLRHTQPPAPAVTLTPQQRAGYQPLLRCERCGQRMHPGLHLGVRRTYTCSNTCRNTLVDADTIDTLIHRALAGTIPIERAATVIDAIIVSAPAQVRILWRRRFPRHPQPPATRPPGTVFLPQRPQPPVAPTVDVFCCPHPAPGDVQACDTVVIAGTTATGALLVLRALTSDPQTFELPSERRAHRGVTPEDVATVLIRDLGFQSHNLRLLDILPGSARRAAALYAADLQPLVSCPRTDMVLLTCDTVRLVDLRPRTAARLLRHGPTPAAAITALLRVRDANGATA